MFEIVGKQQLNPEICLVEFLAPDIARAAQPGQFMILRVDERGERFPLTIYDFNRARGTVTVVCQAVGVSTRKLCALKKCDIILDAAGPLGRAVNTKNIGRVICVGGGVGTAEAYPIARAMHENGNDVTVIIGFRSMGLIICEEEIRKFCGKLHITTDDGSSGKKGFVTGILGELLEKEKYDLVFAIGPVIMMKMVAEMTRKYSVKTMVSLNAIMIDGTGMCGGCRVLYNGKQKFTCVDGPEFDGHLIDFEDLMSRQSHYKDKENTALERHNHNCRVGLNGGPDNGK